MIETGSIADLPDALIRELRRQRHPVAVVEDAHWADDATLDALQFLGRRIDRMPALLVVTYRDDEVPADHPLRLRLGTITPRSVRRVPLAPLSRHAVARLVENCGAAAARIDIDALYRLTNGNPFYVTEMLSAPAEAVPETVQDAVLARVARLDDVGRECVEIASVIPTKAERWLLEDCGVGDAIDEAERLGLLRAEADTVSFTHELARRAVERSLSPRRRRNVNRRVLDALIDGHADPARIAHHADQAGDAAFAVGFAPVAAHRAASLSSHREAVNHFEQALKHTRLLSDDELVDLLEAYARECQLIGRHERAIQPLTRAIELRGARGDDEVLGIDLCLLSDVYWFLGRGDEAAEASARAIAVLRRLPAGVALARAYAQRTKLAMLDFRPDEALRLGGNAVELARRLGDRAVLAHTLTSVGVARWQLGGADNQLLVEGLALARAEGLTDEAARAYVNLANGHTNFMEYDQARPYIADGLAHCETHDLIARANYLLATRAWWHLEQGCWREAEQDARRLLAAQDVSRVRALTILSLVEARRGGGEARPGNGGRAAERSDRREAECRSDRPCPGRTELVDRRSRRARQNGHLDVRRRGRIPEPTLDRRGGLVVAPSRSARGSAARRVRGLSVAGVRSLGGGGSDVE